MQCFRNDQLWKFIFLRRKLTYWAHISCSLHVDQLTTKRSNVTNFENRFPIITFYCSVYFCVKMRLKIVKNRKRLKKMFFKLVQKPLSKTVIITLTCLPFCYPFYMALITLLLPLTLLHTFVSKNVLYSHWPVSMRVRKKMRSLPPPKNFLYFWMQPCKMHCCPTYKIKGFNKSESCALILKKRRKNHPS